MLHSMKKDDVFWCFQFNLEICSQLETNLSSFALNIIFNFIKNNCHSINYFILVTYFRNFHLKESIKIAKVFVFYTMSFHIILIFSLTLWLLAPWMVHSISVLRSWEQKLGWKMMTKNKEKRQAFEKKPGIETNKRFQENKSEGSAFTNLV